MLEGSNCAKCDIMQDKLIAEKRAADAEKTLESACAWISNNYAECPVVYDPMYELNHHINCSDCENKKIQICWMDYFKSKAVGKCQDT